MSKSIVSSPGGRRLSRVVPHLTTTRLGVVEHRDDGDGPALLALHGGMGGFDQSRLLAEALLAEPAGFRVIALSRPGYLGTPLRDGDPADLYAALLDELDIDRAVVAAVSAGGPSAIAFAARHPDRCAGLILVSTASGWFEVPEHVIRRLKQFQALCRVPGLARLMGWVMGRHPERARSVRDPDLLRRTLEHPEAGPLMLALQRSVFQRLAERLPGTIADTLAFADLPPLPLDQVLAPTLVIHGDGDQVVPFAHGVRSAGEIAGADLLVVPGGEHVCLFTHLDEVRAQVAGFLGRVRG